MVKVDGVDMAKLEGYATVFERGYEMWDFAGPYTEIVSADAGNKTLANNPDVAFLVNHKGVTMARSTTPGRLQLGADEVGLKVDALVNPKRQDVQDLLVAVNDGDIDEMSFAFMIVRGQWSPDYMEYRILEFDLDRGDVSAVNYGANPYTSIAARSREILESLDHLPAGAARAALERLNGRADMRPAPEPEKPTPPQGRSVSLIRAGLLLDDEDC
jgi:HK97 family phage prohead protease